MSGAGADSIMRCHVCNCFRECATAGYCLGPNPNNAPAPKYEAPPSKAWQHVAGLLMLGGTILFCWLLFGPPAFMR